MGKNEIIQSEKVEFSSNAYEVIKKRYLRCDENGQPLETPAEMYYRVAEFMAGADKIYDPGKSSEETIKSFYRVLARSKFLPGGRVLFESGRTHTGQLASCFVVPIDDSLQGIFESLKNAAFIQKNNGGTGFNFSKIRPKGDVVKGVFGVAAGPIHYVKSFDASLSSILQGSKRHGGNMGILNVNHPDILEFIRLKDKSDLIKNFNTSVGVTDEFMEKVRRDENYELINPRNGEATGTLRALDVFNEITQRAWECADPGVIFMDALDKDNTVPGLGKLEATNPCGEQPLLPYESCNLGSIILPTHIKDGDINWDELRQTVRTVVHFMDNMIDLNNYPLSEIEVNVKKTRKIGLGILGFAHLLYKLEIPYNSEKAVKMAEKIMKFIYDEGWQASKDLAKIRGAFPAINESIFKDEAEQPRNATITTIAPNGTISMVANTSSGVEPVFSLVTKRQVFFEDTKNNNGGRVLVFADPIFEEVAKAEGFYSEELMEKIAEVGSLQHFEEIPDKYKKIFVTAHDVSFDWHVKIQAAAQKYTDNAVSKTINFPATATLEDIRKAYIMAYELGCKGVTIYRDGSKSFQVLSSGEKAKKEDEITKREVIAAREKVNVEEEINIINCDNKLTENAITVLEKRALKKDENGNPAETPDKLFKRVARIIASAERKYNTPEEKIKELENDFYEMYARLEFISGQALRNTDEKKLTFSACFVLPVGDSMDDIMQSIKENVMVHKSTGGTGFNFSKIRPRDSVIGSTGEGVASGPLGFMKAFDTTMETIRTKGGRKQGSMGILNVDHPDIEDFIKAKDTSGVLTNFNISVGVNDEFMKALKKDEEYELINPQDGSVAKTKKAKDIFEIIVDHAWKTADPGLIFLDNVEKDNPTPTLGKLEATNPCGEQPLLPYEACNLGSIVLSRFVELDEKGEADINWDRLAKVTSLSVRFLDNTIDLNNFPLEKIEKMTRANRKIGLGVMGFADMLIKLGIPYDSDKAVKVAEKVMKFVSEQAVATSRELGQEKGNFQNFEESTWKTEKKFDFMRNASVTTIAPTGYTSIVANCSSGIEPIFALAFKRQESLGGVDQYQTNTLFETVAREQGFYSEELMKKVAAKGSVQEVADVPEEIKKIFVVSHDIDPAWDLKIQAAFQKHVNNAVSKTINFPNSATREDVAKVYKLAYKLGCKGVTIYRDGCKDIQVLSVGNEEKAAGKNSELAEVPAQKIVPLDRPETVLGATYKVQTSYGNLYITINNDVNGLPFEVFANIGKAGGFFAAKSEAICRLVSMSLRAGIEPKEIIDQIKGIRGPMPSWTKKGMILSIPDAIAKVFEEHLHKDQQQLNLGLESEAKQANNEQSNSEPTPPVIKIDEKDLVTEEIVGKASVKSQEKTVKYNNGSKSIADSGFAPECPDCGNILEFSEGCMVCRSCGYSKCG